MIKKRDGLREKSPPAASDFRNGQRLAVAIVTSQASRPPSFSGKACAGALEQLSLGFSREFEGKQAEQASWVSELIPGTREGESE
ncbi:UNVERIFIED_CONTAM: hypothetical protein K2H54_051066 [Gekko kuhli]